MVRYSHPGILYKSDRSEYSGNFENNLFEGYGTFTWPDEKKIYEGNWRQGKMHGRGKLVFANGKSFQGEFKDGVREGYGVLKLNSSRKISGNWSEDRLEHPDVSETHS